MTQETENRLIELASTILEEVRTMRVLMQDSLNKANNKEEKAAETEREKQHIRPSFYKPDEPQL